MADAMLSISLERTLQAALARASAQRHEYATLEHLLLVLLDDADAQVALRACHTDLEELRTQPNQLHRGRPGRAGDHARGRPEADRRLPARGPTRRHPGAVGRSGRG